MRNITINRSKSFIGWAVGYKIYVADQLSGDTKINGELCRKVSVLRNGQSATFAVDNNPCRIYVIADKLTRNITNEFIDIPMGDTDIFLTGKVPYNPFAGNIFRFDQVTSEEMINNRKKGTLKYGIFLAVVFVAAIVLGVISGLTSAGTGEAEVFYEEELQITLTDQFDEMYIEGFQTVFYDYDTNIYIVREDFETVPELKEYSVKDYGEAFLEYNDLDDATLQETDGLVWYERTENIDGEDEFYYYSVIYKSEQAFWAIQFCCEAELSAEQKPEMEQYAKSVMFVS